MNTIVLIPIPNVRKYVFLTQVRSYCYTVYTECIVYTGIKINSIHKENKKH